MTIQQQIEDIVKAAIAKAVEPLHKRIQELESTKTVKLWSKRQAAEFLGVTAKTVENYEKDGILKRHSVRPLRYRKSDVEAIGQQKYKR